MAGDRDTQFDTQKRRSFVLELRKKGCTYRTIAQKTIEEFGIENLPKGWDERYAWTDTHRELEKLKAMNEEHAGDIRDLEIERLDALLEGLWEKASNGDERAVNSALKIMERRSRLLGLDAPTTTQITGKDGSPIVIYIPDNSRDE
jgi:hypothetical protein